MAGIGQGHLKAIRALAKKKGRERQGRTLIEGVRLVETALAAGVRPELTLFSTRLLTTERGAALLRRVRDGGGETCEVDERTLGELADTETPQGILAVVPVLSASLESVVAVARPFLLAVDGLQDPGNLGTMLRTAAAAGVSGVLLGRGTVELGNPKALRASMGSAFLLPIAEEVDLPPVLGELSQRGVTVAAGDPDGEETLFRADLTPPVAVVVGGEAQGLGPSVREAVTRRLRIPMARGVESLNAAVAASLLLYEVARGEDP